MYKEYKDQGSAASQMQLSQIPSLNKKHNFIKRWLQKTILDILPSNYHSYGTPIGASSSQLGSFLGSIPMLDIGTQGMIEDHLPKTFRFNIHFAVGGKIIEVHRPNPNNMNMPNKTLYVVTNDQDLGREIDKIITMESLK